MYVYTYIYIHTYIIYIYIYIIYIYYIINSTTGDHPEPFLQFMSLGSPKLCIQSISEGQLGALRVLNICQFFIF